MRNPDRIEPILNELKTLWLKHPDLRLGQIISLGGGFNVFNIEDEQLIENIRNLIKK